MNRVGARRTWPAALALAAAVSIATTRGGAAQAPQAPTTYAALTQAVAAAAAAAPALVHVGSAGESVENRPLPLVVISPGLSDAGAASVKAAGKLRVWVRAGARGDAAEGTEAALALIRDLAAGQHGEWLGSVALIVTPLVNPDGHERVSAEHLGRRNGPASGLGQRLNAANVDVEHDYVRLDSPEARSLLAVFTAYDPHVVIDLDTNDNACSGYAVAYRAPLNPNISDRLAGLARSDWAPFVARNLQSKYSIDAGPDGRFAADTTCGLPGAAPPAGPAASPAPGRGARAGRAGGAAARGPAAESRGRGPATAGRVGADGGSAAAPPPAPPPEPWLSPADAPLTFASYFGLRNRLVLSGLTDGFRPFPDRVRAATRFLEEAIAFTYGANTRIEKAIEATDPEMMVGTTMATGWQPMLANSTAISVRRGTVTPAAGTPSFERAPSTPAEALDRTGFQADTTEPMAAEYYIPEDATAVLDLLRRHGIQLRQLTQSTRGVDQFSVTGAAVVTEIDGHAMKKLTGTWQPAPAAVVPGGAWVVRMNQRLARVAFTLLEPGSNDGLVAWGVLRNTDTSYPILRKR